MKWLFGSIVMVLVVAAGVPVMAQQPAPKAPAAAQDGFVPVDAPMTGQDVVPAPRLVAIAYGFIWLAFFGYLLSIKTRLSSVERELATVSRRAGGGTSTDARRAKVEGK